MLSASFSLQADTEGAIIVLSQIHITLSCYLVFYFIVSPVVYYYLFLLIVTYAILIYVESVNVKQKMSVDENFYLSIIISIYKL